MKICSVNFNSIQTTFQNNMPTVYSPFLPAQKSIFSDKFELNPLNIALNILENVEFDKDEVNKVKKYVSSLAFSNGKEAVNFAKENNIKIIFDKVANPAIHAQWQNKRNTIVINEQYKNIKDIAEIYAISSAILHELSHAKDKNAYSSIQEEIDCLAMNALCFSQLRKKLKYHLPKSSPILEDGVALYSKLFFDEDKTNLIKRIKDKYGKLPLESLNHPATDFAKEINKMTTY